jgi:hypothetical protein
MLIQSLLAMKGRRAMVRDTYRKWMKSSRDFSKLTEKRALRSGTPKPHSPELK